MLGVDPAPTASPTITRGDYLHLSDLEWSALQRLGNVVGGKAISAILATSPPEQHHPTAIGFLQKEAEKRGRKQPAHVLRRGDWKPLLRLFDEIDAAIRSGQIHDPEQQVDFVMPKLAGGAKIWAFAEFKSDIRAAFVPPKSEFRTRTAFHEIRQDRHDLHEYIQHAQYSVSSIVSESIDLATQVVTFMKGLAGGPVKTCLFREYPETLEQLLALALQEDFIAKQARIHTDPHLAGIARHAKPSTRNSEAEPMDLSLVQTSTVRAMSYT
ncbi:Membrane protein, partial [Globisporangium splendens]